jgi:hypothetical protein
VREFWVASGHHLLDRDAGGGLVLTDDFLKAFYARPELVPPAEACPAERELHAALLRAPRAAVDPARVAALADPDARHNWTAALAFRDRLLRAPTIEAAYVALVTGGVGRTPPLFVDQLAHVIARNALDGEDDPFTLRAAELFFRPQKLSRHGGTVLLGDAETVELLDDGARGAPLVGMLGGAIATELEVLNEENARSYHARSDGHDLVLDFGLGRAGRTGFARAIERWVAHLVGERVAVEPIPALENEPWTWFVGLDAEATRIGNALWRGEAVDAAELDRIVALFRLDFADGRAVRADVAGRPMILILAVGQDGIVKVKPQNLVAGLPLAREAMAS